MSRKTFKAIILTDEALTEDELNYDEVFDHVKEYIRYGAGLVIAGLHFPNFVNSTRFGEFFNKMGVLWLKGEYYRLDFDMNPSCDRELLHGLGLTASGLPARYGMKALGAVGANAHEKLYVPVLGGRSQSMVELGETVDPSQAAVVGVKLGKGRLFYIGDLNWEHGSQELVVRLCGA
ncbi:hypothetical protein BDW74DRAFT_89522 [Aspergillus multicolor]|uniref:uncharacterized protein n=1 Tax=Aspergillus multicolor TaxID=41759 RepID=UPI003CCE13F6